MFYAQGCGFCVKAKAILDTAGVAWTGFDVGRDVALRDDLAKRSGGSTSVPQVFLGGELVGGYDDLAALRDTGSLDDIVSSKGLRRVDPASIVDSRELGRDSSIPHVDIREMRDPGAEALNILASGWGGSRGATVEEIDVEQVAEDLQQVSLELFDAYVLPDGSGVDYGGLATSPVMADFVVAASRLAAISDNEAEAMGQLSKAFWINIYNALVMHANVVVGHPQNQEERSAFFSGASGARYKVGPWAFSLDDIEHGILRGSPEGDARGFSISDPRKKMAVEKVDPRIHFALNCGAKSCPPVKIFTAGGLEKELKAVAASFVASEVSVPDETGEIRMSKIFDWYGSDFAANDKALLRKLISYLPYTSRLRPSLEAARGRLVHGYGNTRIVFEEYSWEQNAAE